VPLLSSQKKSDEIKKVLDAVSARLTTKGLTEMNASVSGNSGVDPDEAARQWVRENAFDKPFGK
jgi:osmoprotectant transport system substrate-binding protein